MTNKNGIIFSSAEDALVFLGSARELEGSVGSVSGKATADGELGLSPDGDCWGPDSTDRIAARIDLERTVAQGLDWRSKRVLDMFLAAECVRRYPEDETGNRKSGAVDLVAAWAAVSVGSAYRWIDRMLGEVDLALWSAGYLRVDPASVRGEEIVGRETIDEDGVRAVSAYYSAAEIDESELLGG